MNTLNKTACKNIRDIRVPATWFASILLASCAMAKDIIVSPGDSLSKARDAAVSGDRIVLHGGTYRMNEPLVIEQMHSGVTWMAYNEEKPVLSGGVVVTGWKEDANGRYKATVDLDNFRQLWVNGQRAQRARGNMPAGLKDWGKNEATVIKYDNPPGLTGTPGYQSGKLDKIEPAGYTTTDTKLADWRNPEDIEFGYYSSWSHKIAKIGKITRSDTGAVIEMAQPGYFLCKRAGGARAWNPAYMENALELLHEPGQWYFDRPARTLYYKPRKGEDMGMVEVVAPRLETLLVVNGARDLRFIGLTFSHATWLRPGTAMGHPEVQANFIQPVDNSYFRPESEKGWVPVNGEHLKSPGNIVINAGRGMHFEGCTFTALGGAGLDFSTGSQSNVVIGCRFDDISGNGIQVGGVSKEDHHPESPQSIVKDNQIINNVITRVGAQYHDSVGIFAGYTEGTIITHNEIYDVPYTGISCGWGWGTPDVGYNAYVSPVKWQTPTSAKNNRIEYNHIHDHMKVMQDGGGVYVLGSQPGMIIRGNHVHDAKGSPGGLYLDEAASHVEMTGNLSYRVEMPIWLHNSTNGCGATCRIFDNYFTVAGSSLRGQRGGALKGGAVIRQTMKIDPAHFTISAWVRLEKYPPSYGKGMSTIACRGSDEFIDGSFVLQIQSNKLNSFINAGGNIHQVTSPANAVPLGKWTPVALTYDGDTMRMYCDGKEVGRKKAGMELKPGEMPFTIGSNGNLDFTPRGAFYTIFDCGDIDEVRLFSRALGPAEIAKAEDVGDGLLKYWNCDDASAEKVAARIVDEAGPQPLPTGKLQRHLMKPQ